MRRMSSAPLLHDNFGDEDVSNTHTTSFECGDSFRTSLVGHASVRTNFLVFGAGDGRRPRQRVLVVVGNPGVCEFYYDFACALSAQCGHEDEIVVASHLGHCGRRIGAAFSLDEQVEHKRELLAALVGESADSQRILRDLRLAPRTDVPIVLAGHSIGAYICFKLAAADGARARPRVRRVLALFPTFRDLAAGLVPLVRVAVLPGFRHLFAALLGFMPTFLTHRLLHATHAMSDEAKYALPDKLCYDFIYNVLWMAYTETLQITTVDPELERLFADARGRLEFFYSPIDNYTPPSFPAELVQQHPPLEPHVHITSDRIRHAFVLSNSGEVAELLANGGHLD